MREIKFRAYGKSPTEDTLEMYYSDSYGLTSFFGLVERFRLKELMQFTGLKDKQGKEIYEGDIISSHPNWNWQVVWSDRSSAWACRGKYDYDKKRLLFTGFKGVAKKGVVIGNIYENPDLLDFHPKKEEVG